MGHKENNEQAAASTSTVPVAEEKWGTRQMGAPAPPQAHPKNREASQWTPRASDEQHYQYVLEHTPVQRSAGSPMEGILEYFNSWSRRAETMATNMWHNLKTAPSMKDAAWGKLTLATKAIQGGGFEPLYKQTFQTEPNERLMKTFACYLSTATGPVAGTMYLSSHKVAFCSDRPLSFKAPSGQESWSYYKAMIPLSKIRSVNPVTLKETPPEKYLQIETIDGHEFWFMGFVNFDKAAKYLPEAIARQGQFSDQQQNQYVVSPQQQHFDGQQQPYPPQYPVEQQQAHPPQFTNLGGQQQQKQHVVSPQHQHVDGQQQPYPPQYPVEQQQAHPPQFTNLGGQQKQKQHVVSPQQQHVDGQQQPYPPQDPVEQQQAHPPQYTNVEGQQQQKPSATR